MSSPRSGKIVDTYNESGNRMALVEFNGERRAVYLNLVPEAQVGDTVRFLAGFATELIDAAHLTTGEASQTNTEAQEHEFRTNQAYRFLSELDSQQLRKLLPLAQDKRFASGEIIFRAGERSLFLHLIVSGDVALEEVTGGLAHRVQTLHAGHGMGWSALSPGARTHFQARALSEVITVAFAGDELDAACNRDPALGFVLTKRLLELVTERLDALRTKLAEKFGENA
jgi:CRP/FNR family transcriptional regulator, cyclic AMP receptor protein